MNLSCALSFVALLVLIGGCQSTQKPDSIQGTWELISATTTERDTSFSTFDPTHRMIKIINPTHFAFLNHTSSAHPDSSTHFTGGGGTYTLVDSTYTEALDYYTDRAWENHKFPFVVKFSGDTLIQKGVEKIPKLGIDRVIIEKYKRVDK